MKEIGILKIFSRLRFRNANHNRIQALNQKMACIFKGEDGVTFHNIKLEQAKNLLSGGASERDVAPW